MGGRSQLPVVQGPQAVTRDSFLPPGHGCHQQHLGHAHVPVLPEQGEDRPVPGRRCRGAGGQDQTAPGERPRQQRGHGHPQRIRVYLPTVLLVCLCSSGVKKKWFSNVLLKGFGQSCPRKLLVWAFFARKKKNTDIYMFIRNEKSP